MIDASSIRDRISPKYYVEEFLPFNLLKSELWCFNLFRNASVLHEGEVGQLWPIAAKTADFNVVISGITGPVFIKFLHDIQCSRIIAAFNARYSKSLWNASAKNKGGVNQCLLFVPSLPSPSKNNWLPWQRFWRPQGECQINYPTHMSSTFWDI